MMGRRWQQMIEGGIDAEEAVAEAVADKVSEAAED